MVSGIKNTFTHSSTIQPAQSDKKPTDLKKNVQESRYSITSSTAAKIAGALGLAALAAATAYAYQGQGAEEIKDSLKDHCAGQAPTSSSCQLEADFKNTLTEGEQLLYWNLNLIGFTNNSSPDTCELQKYFHFDPQDQKESLLYLFSYHTLSPDVLNKLGHEYDVKAKEVSSLEDICCELNKAAHKPPKAVILHLDNQPDAMFFKGDGNFTTTDPLSCFSKVDSMGRILLIGPSRGSLSAGGQNTVNGTLHDNMAQVIADRSGRTVVAAVDQIAKEFIEWDENDASEGHPTPTVKPLFPFHPGGQYIQCVKQEQLEFDSVKVHENAFKEFHPHKK